MKLALVLFLCFTFTWFAKAQGNLQYNQVKLVTNKVGQGTQPAAYSNLAYTHSYTILPFWLPAGATLSGGTCLNKVSVIEFNIIP